MRAGLFKSGVRGLALYAHLRHDVPHEPGRHELDLVRRRARAGGRHVHRLPLARRREGEERVRERRRRDGDRPGALPPADDAVVRVRDVRRVAEILRAPPGRESRGRAGASAALSRSRRSPPHRSAARGLRARWEPASAAGGPSHAGPRRAAGAPAGAAAGPGGRAPPSGTRSHTAGRACRACRCPASGCRPASARPPHRGPAQARAAGPPRPPPPRRRGPSGPTRAQSPAAPARAQRNPSRCCDRCRSGSARPGERSYSSILPLLISSLFYCSLLCWAPGQGRAWAGRSTAGAPA